MSSTNKTTSVALPEPILREIGFCISCLRVTIQQWGNGDFSEPLLIKCYVGTYDTKSCTGCAKAKRSCPEVSTLFRALLRVDSDTVLQLPGLLVGHRFELLSILEWVKVVWTGLNTGPYSASIHADPVQTFGAEVLEKIGVIVKDLLLAFDNLVKSHSKSHSLGNGVVSCSSNPFRGCFADTTFAGAPRGL